MARTRIRRAPVSSDTEAERRVVGLEGIGVGNAGRGIGGERHRRRCVGQHAGGEDEEARDQRLDLQQHEDPRGDCDHDQVVRHRRCAAAHQNADYVGKDQSEQQRQGRHRHQVERDQRRRNRTAVRLSSICM